MRGTPQRFTPTRRFSRRQTLTLLGGISVVGLLAAARGGRQPADAGAITLQQPEHAATVYFPPHQGDAWDAVLPADAGWDAAALDATWEWLAGLQTEGFMILAGGHIVIERYANGGDLHSSRDVASVQKSITAFLAGVAQERGALAIDHPVAAYLGDGWSRATPEQEARITVRHLLTMSSGLDAQWRYQADAGTEWEYNTNLYQLTERVIAQAVGQPTPQFMAEALGTPIGWQDTSVRPRPLFRNVDGEPWPAVLMSTRDMARFGLLMLRGAVWAGAPVLGDQQYLQAMISTSQPMNPSYGFFWWLNGRDGHRLPGRDPEFNPGALIPNAPADLYAAMGALDNRIYVIPSLDTVVVRQGRAAGEAAQAASAFDSQLWQRLMAARLA